MNPLNLKSRLVYGQQHPLTRGLNEAPRYSDPDGPMAGRCMSCKTVMGCLRGDAESRAPKYGDTFPEPGTWSDLLSAECPHCGARVFVMAAEEFQRALDKGD